MILPQSREKLSPWSMDIIDRCRTSIAARAAMARSLKTWRYTGSPDGNTALLNRLNHHVERVSNYLFSPNDLRFHMDFTHNYPKHTLDQAEVASRVLTRIFEQRDIDLQVGEGVDQALTYGACIPKVLNAHGGPICQLVMPWQMGVYREDKNDFASQEAVVETNYITPFDFWRRVSHLPNAIDLFKRARAYAKKNAGGSDEGGNYLHQVLLAGTSPMVQTDAPFFQQPGGLIQVTSDPSGAVMAPEVADELICLHELWVLDDETEDYTTIQIAEPDILIAPQFRRRNFFVPGYLPYGLIQPNRMNGYFWGRSEMADLLRLQSLLRDRMEDVKKLMGLQYDRLLAFIGMSGMQDETYDQFRQAGYIAMENGTDVKDITPKMPDQAFADIKQIMDFMDEVSGFANILSGQGEPGVRAGNHAETLVKTASPRLRDRALLVERQCADLGDKVFQMMAAKDSTAYWTDDAKEEGGEFLLSQIPDDYRIMVDSHSSSPIYQDDHKELAMFGAKAGVLDGEDLIDLLPFPRRDLLKTRYRAKQEAKAKLLQEHPELLQKGGAKKH